MRTRLHMGALRPTFTLSSSVRSDIFLGCPKKEVKTKLSYYILPPVPRIVQPAGLRLYYLKFRLILDKLSRGIFVYPNLRRGNKKVKTLEELLQKWNNGILRGARRRLAEELGINEATVSLLAFLYALLRRAFLRLKSSF